MLYSRYFKLQTYLMAVVFCWWQGLIILRWRYAVDRMLNYNYKLTRSPRHQNTIVTSNKSVFVNIITKKWTCFTNQSTTMTLIDTVVRSLKIKYATVRVCVFWYCFRTLAVGFVSDYTFWLRILSLTSFQFLHIYWINSSLSLYSFTYSFNQLFIRWS